MHICGDNVDIYIYTNKPVWNHPETDGQWKDQSAPKKNVHTMCCPTLLFTKYNCTRLVGYFFLIYLFYCLKGKQKSDTINGGIKKKKQPFENHKQAEDFSKNSNAEFSFGGCCSVIGVSLSEAFTLICLEQVSVL